MKCDGCGEEMGEMATGQVPVCPQCTWNTLYKTIVGHVNKYSNPSPMTNVKYTNLEPSPTCLYCGEPSEDGPCRSRWCYGLSVIQALLDGKLDPAPGVPLPHIPDCFKGSADPFRV